MADRKPKPTNKRPTTIKVNRAPVMTLWAAIVAERQGFKRDEALTLGKAVAGLNAQSKGRRLGIYEPSEKPEKKQRVSEKRVQVLGRSVQVQKTVDGLRALAGEKPITPKSVLSYFERSFGDDLNAVQAAMKKLAESFPPDELDEAAYGMYEKFRPTVPGGNKGWGAKGELDLKLVRSMARNKRG